MTKQHHSHIHLALSQLTAFLFQCHAIFFVDIDILIIRYHAKHGYTTNILQHLATLIEEAHVATKLVDDDTFDEFSVFRRLQHNAAINGSKDTTAVNVAHKDYVSLCVTGHRHIYQIAVLQVYLRNTASALHHNGVITCCQTVKSIANLLAVIGGQRGRPSLHTTCAPVVVGILVADGFAVQDHLRSMVTLRLQEQWIHIRMTRDASCLSLYSLRTANLETLGCGV